MNQTNNELSPVECADLLAEAFTSAMTRKIKQRRHQMECNAAAGLYIAAAQDLSIIEGMEQAMQTAKNVCSGHRALCHLQDIFTANAQILARRNGSLP